MKKTFMRLALFFLLSVLVWAGTISINYENRTSGTISPISVCSEKNDGETLLNYLRTGKIEGIKDNGHILTVGLTPQWPTLPPAIQRDTYDAVACYAKVQGRAYQFMRIPSRSK